MANSTSCRPSRQTKSDWTKFLTVMCGTGKQRSQILATTKTFHSTDCTYNITQGMAYTASSKNQNDDVGMTSSKFDQEAYLRACSAVSNSTAGKVINPVQSARLTTKNTVAIQYGKVEITAKLPKGDWVCSSLVLVWACFNHILAIP